MRLGVRYEVGKELTYAALVFYTICINGILNCEGVSTRSKEILRSSAGSDSVARQVRVVYVRAVVAKPVRKVRAPRRKAIWRGAVVIVGDDCDLGRHGVGGRSSGD